MFFNEKKLKKINHILFDYGAQNIQILENSKVQIKLKFDIYFDKKLVSLGLNFQNKANWTIPPSFTILNRPLPALDHVGHSGLICTTDHQGENFDGNKHEKLISFFLEKTLKILNQSFNNLNSNNRTSIYNELEGYLENIDNVNYDVQLHSDPCSTPFLYGWLKKNKNGIQTIAHIDDGQNNNINKTHLTKVKIHKILLKDSSIFPIPHMDTVFSEEDFLKIIHTLPSDKIETLLSRGNQNVLIGVPNENGFTYLVFSYSIWYSYKNIISFQKFKISLTQRAWIDYLLKRTGQEQIDKHIAVFGCGALGSKVIEILAQTGINNFSLVDPERLTTDNIFRHSLGLQQVNIAKSEALAKKIELERPGLTVKPYITNAENWIQSNYINNVDTIIITIGHTPTEISLVKSIFEINKNINIIVGWVEPYDLGGHFISFNNKERGCLNCLYYDSNSNKSLNPKYKYIKSGQILSKNITGCSGAFTPFSSLNCSKLASYITEYTLYNQTGFISLSGENYSAVKNNILTTHFYEKVNSKNGVNIISLDEIYEEVCSCCNT